MTALALDGLSVTLGGQLIVGSAEPECDAVHWIDDPDDFEAQPTAQAWDSQVLRLARRIPSLGIPPRPVGFAALYDVADDWIPVYDRTSLAGFYAAIGTSGNQFKNAPVIGQLMRHLIDEVERGQPHDAEPVVWTTPHTSLDVSLGHYSRLRQVHSDSSFSVLG